MIIMTIVRDNCRKTEALPHTYTYAHLHLPSTLLTATRDDFSDGSANAQEQEMPSRDSSET